MFPPLNLPYLYNDESLVLFNPTDLDSGRLIASSYSCLSNSIGFILSVELIVLSYSDKLDLYIALSTSFLKKYTVIFFAPSDNL